MRISKNLVLRALTGIVFVSVILACIITNEYTYALIFCLIEILALSEFYNLIEKSAGVKISKSYNIIGGGLLFIASFLYFSGITNFSVVFTPYICYLIFLFVSELFLKKKNPILALAYSVLGQVYLAIPFSLLSYIVFSYGESYHYVYILALLVMIWVNDSFAYLSGVSFGKHKMFERVSPKKSWEGFAGGAICTIISSIIFSHYYTGLSLPGWIGFAIIVVIFGTLGDLTESLLKRTFNIKDSGNILPGHGGILDRFDSLIMAIPALTAYLIVINFFRGI